MRIRIWLLPLMRIRILLLPLMRIRILFFAFDADPDSLHEIAAIKKKNTLISGWLG
jgi:hypothetical protein